MLTNSLPDCSCQSLDKGPRQRSMPLEKVELGQRFVLSGVGEELVQDEGLLTSQHEHRLRETGPSSTDLNTHATINVWIHIQYMAQAAVMRDDKFKKANRKLYACNGLRQHCNLHLQDYDMSMCNSL